MTITKRNFERTGSIANAVANSTNQVVLQYPLSTTVGRMILFNARCAAVGSAGPNASGATQGMWGMIESNVPPNNPTSGSSATVTTVSASYSGNAAPSWSQSISNNTLLIKFSSPGSGGETFDCFVELDVWHLESA